MGSTKKGGPKSAGAGEKRVNLRLNEDYLTDRFLLGVPSGKRSSIVREGLKLLIERELKFSVVGGAVLETVVVPIKPVERTAEPDSVVAKPFVPELDKSPSVGPVHAVPSPVVSESEKLEPEAPEPEPVVPATVVSEPAKLESEGRAKKEPFKESTTKEDLMASIGTNVNAGARSLALMDW